MNEMEIEIEFILSRYDKDKDTQAAVHELMALFNAEKQNLIRDYFKQP